MWPIYTELPIDKPFNGVRAIYLFPALATRAETACMANQVGPDSVHFGVVLQALNPNDSRFWTNGRGTSIDH